MARDLESVTDISLVLGQHHAVRVVCVRRCCKVRVRGSVVWLYQSGRVEDKGRAKDQLQMRKPTQAEVFGGALWSREVICEKKSK